jgi:DUF4097 and DUF4098 domain-containing protein YvlB
MSAPRTDTTLAVPAGARLQLENFGGEIVVETWSRNELRIEAEHSRRTHIEVEQDGSEFTISAETERSAPGSVDFHLTVPASMSLELSGVYCDIRTTGLKGSLKAETVQGDVEIKGGTGRVEAQSVQGHVVVEDASGSIEASSVNEGVTILRAKGDVSAESVNGAVVVRESHLHSLEASTVGGTVIYDGTYDRDGHYELSSHNGSVFASIPENADLSVQVETYNGTFESTFPVKRSTEGRSKRRFTLTFGSGSAEMSLESFQGVITLHRPGEKVDEERDALGEDSDSGSKDKLKEKDKDKVKEKLKEKSGKHDDSDRNDSGDE